MVDILKLLEVKANNRHYVKKYWNFIQKCNVANKNLPEDGYTENHHICPKADDLFPEYSDFHLFPWNSINLTARQHIIAHVMLWKAFGGSQAFALDCMLNKFNCETNILLTNRKVPKTVLIRHQASLREDVQKLKSDFRLGKAVFKDAEGNKFLLDVDDPTISERGLVGNNMGVSPKWSDTGRYNNWLSKAKITLKMLDNSITFEYKDPQFAEKIVPYIDQGWTPILHPADKNYIRVQVGLKHGQKLKGRTRMMTREGEFIGWFDRASQADLIEELDLIPQWTENNQKQIEDRLKKATAAKLGTKTYNNGLQEIKRKEHPGKGWTLGRLPRSKEHKENLAKAVREKCSGSTVWNDGTRNYYVREGEQPDPNWSKGMAPRKSKQNVTN